MSAIDRLLSNYSRQVRLPWSANMSGKQRVWFAVYPPAEERRVRARLPQFEALTLEANHGWTTVDLTRLLPDVLAAHKYREAIFQNPEHFEREASSKFVPLRLCSEACSREEADAASVVAVTGLASLFDFMRVSSLIERVEDSVPRTLARLLSGRIRGQRLSLHGCARRLQLHGRSHHLNRELHQPMTNRELYFRDPTTLELLNNGVSKVSEIGHDERQIKTLRFELETFVCDGEYARGLERILKAYLDGLGREEQKAVWVSGFFGSGKSHLVKVLRYLWEDYRFADGATARSLVKLPAEITDLLKELSNRSKPLGGLRAAAGTLGAGSMDNVRLAFVQLVLRSAGLPEDLAHAKFILWLRSSGLEAHGREGAKEEQLRSCSRKC